MLIPGLLEEIFENVCVVELKRMDELDRARSKKQPQT
jgi:hypothetical protein